MNFTITDQFVQQNRELLMIPAKTNMAIQGATGSGKSTGTWKIIAQNESFFGKTLFIFPTNVALQSISESCNHMFPVTPKKAIHHLLFIHHGFKTVVMDEAHFTSKEYYALYHILTKQSLRIIFISATMDQNYLHRFGFNGPLLSLPSTNGFEKKILYEEEHFPFISFPIISGKIVSTLLKIGNTGKDRILCFVATHLQCELLKCEFGNKVSSLKIFTLHGGMEPEDIQSTKLEMETSNSWVCFATNICETAITIPHINIVIDSGLRCVFQGQFSRIDYCDQVSMIQRAGRTGRTCDGTVYRIMTKDMFDHFNYQDYPNHSMDSVVLQMFNRGVDPVFYLDNEALVVIDRMKEYGIIKNGQGPTKSLSRFLEKCELEMKYGLILNHFMKKNYAPHAKSLSVLMGIVLSNYISVKPLYIIYFPHKSNRNVIKNKIGRFFKIEKDPLISYSTILFTLFLSKNPKEVAKFFSFNFKICREIWACYKRIVRFAFPLLDPPTTSLLPRMKDQDIWPLQKLQLFEWTLSMKQHLAIFFSSSPNCPISFGRNHMLEYSLEFFYHSNILLDYDPDLSYKSFKRIIPLVEKNDTIYLWTQAPPDYRDELSPLEIKIWDYRKFTKEKQKNKQLFFQCVEEIKNDIAWQPGMYKYLETRDHFQECLKIQTEGSKE